jgi:hypothetical protein
MSQPFEALCSLCFSRHTDIQLFRITYSAKAAPPTIQYNWYNSRLFFLNFFSMFRLSLAVEGTVCQNKEAADPHTMLRDHLTGILAFWPPTQLLH